jgi:large subunit ribosomal protein L30
MSAAGPLQGANHAPLGGSAAASSAGVGARPGAPKKLRVTLVKSTASSKQSHRATVRGLGLKWTNHSVEVVDTPATRGMINKVSYMVKVTG